MEAQRHASVKVTAAEGAARHAGKRRPPLEPNGKDERATHVFPPHGLEHLLKLDSQLLNVVDEDAGLQRWNSCTHGIHPRQGYHHFIFPTIWFQVMHIASTMFGSIFQFSSGRELRAEYFNPWLRDFNEIRRNSFKLLLKRHQSTNYVPKLTKNYSLKEVLI